ncbi:MBL fold metallo-hydrolase [candidate division KSB1 bacterium]|nr:MBL fold metallo-hydrolase [candidate division KSB1 bacterium]
MKIRFWGVQGSTPIPLSSAQLQDKIRDVLRRAHGRSLQTERELEAFIAELPFSLTHTTGGNTTCFEILSQHGTRVIVDLGTGARRLGWELMRGLAGEGKATLPIFLTHCHWDHIMGLPFFMPLFVVGNKLQIYGGHPYLREALERQMHPHSFPIRLDEVEAEISYQQLREDDVVTIDDLRIQCKPLHHPGGSFAYRITEADKSIVIATDAEYKELDAESLRPFVEFYQNAEVLVFDAQYTLMDLFQKIDWGHSSSIIGVEICLMANVAKLVLTHHDPTYNDEMRTEILDKTEAFKQEAMRQEHVRYLREDLEVVMGYEGLEIEI